MKEGVYTSFEQIDTQLKILATQQELSRYRFRLALAGARTPVLLSQLWEVAKPVVRTILISWALRKVKEKLERIGAGVTRNLPTASAFEGPG